MRKSAVNRFTLIVLVVSLIASLMQIGSIVLDRIEKAIARPSAIAIPKKKPNGKVQKFKGSQKRKTSRTSSKRVRPT